MDLYLFLPYLAVGLLYIAFIMFRYVPCIPDLSKTFIMKGGLDFVECFSASNEMIMFFFQFIYTMNYNDRFLYVEPALYLWDEADLIMMGDFFYVFLDSVCQYFIEYFCVYAHERDWHVILFLG